MTEDGVILYAKANLGEISDCTIPNTHFEESFINNYLKSSHLKLLSQSFSTSNDQTLLEAMARSTKKYPEFDQNQIQDTTYHKIQVQTLDNSIRNYLFFSNQKETLYEFGFIEIID